MTQSLSHAEFIKELKDFSVTAEATLSKLESSDESHPDERRELFGKFSIWMLTIRGTADQLSFPDISILAGLGEEIAAKGAVSNKGHQQKKCISSLWDALTTIKFLIENAGVSTTEEQDILRNRLDSVLKSMGGRRASVSESEIAELLRQQDGKAD